MLNVIILYSSFCPFQDYFNTHEAGLVGWAKTSDLDLNHLTQLGLSHLSRVGLEPTPDTAVR